MIALQNLDQLVATMRMVALSQREVARIQIDRAVRLMLVDEDYVSVVTLACAAEGILGEYLESGDQDSFATLLKTVLHSRVVPEVSMKRLNDEWVNCLRNFLKHHQRDLEEEVRFFPEMEAIVALIRAIANFAQCNGSISDRMIEFFTWLKQAHPLLIEAGGKSGL